MRPLGDPAELAPAREVRGPRPIAQLGEAEHDSRGDDPLAVAEAPGPLLDPEDVERLVPMIPLVEPRLSHDRRTFVGRVVGTFSMLIEDVAAWYYRPVP